MKVVAITRILNEADIVEPFVRHTAALADHHVFLDNGSTDATLGILTKLADEGLSIEVHRSDAVSFSELAQNNYLLRVAADRRADWIIPLDADEFFDTPSAVDRLTAGLAAAACDALYVRVREYIPTPDDTGAELNIAKRIIHARPPSETNLKVMVRGGVAGLGAELQPGGHTVTLNGSSVLGPVVSDMVHAHYATRSPWQWITKFTVGWSKVLAAGPAVVAQGANNHYRHPFELLVTDPVQILRNPFFMEFQHNEAGLVREPLQYLGGELRYTVAVDYPLRAVQAIAQHLQRLSTRYGELTQEGEHPAS